MVRLHWTVTCFICWLWPLFLLELVQDRNMRSMYNGARSVLLWLDPWPRGSWSGVSVLAKTFHSYQDSGQTARQSGEAWHTCFCAACSLLSQNPSRSDPGKCRTRLWQKCLGVGGWRNLKLFVTKKSDLPIWGQSPSPLGEFRKRKIDDALQRLKMKRLATAAVARFTVVANVYINTNKELIRAMSDKCLVGPWPICSPRHEALENNWSVFVSKLSKGASMIH